MNTPEVSVRPIVWLARLLAAAVALLPPIGFGYLSYQTLANGLEVEASTIAEFVTLYVNRNPQMWVYEEHRLEGILQRSRPGWTSRNKRVRDRSGRTIVELGTLPKPPFLLRSATVYDAGTPAATVEVAGSLRPVGLRSLGVGIGSAALGFTVYSVLNLFPLAALHRSTSALSEEKERAQVTLGSIADAVITTDPTGRITLLNRAACTLVGVSAEAAVGRPFLDACPLQGRTAETAWPAPWLGEGEPSALPATWILGRNNGPPRAVVATAAPIHGATTGAVGYVLVLRDVTDWERMEAEVRRTQKLESLGVLAGGIAHDFNNLLMAVMGNIEIAGIHAADRPKAGERLSAAVAACERARDLTQQLLTFARGGAPTRTAVNLTQVIRETAEFIGRGSAIAVELALSPDLWAVEADPGQISQVLQNLLINALQASNGRGRVLIEASNVAADERPGEPPQPDRFVLLSVRDHGEGIPADTMDKIFDPYFTTRPGGTGLGLSTVYSIVQKHGGRVEVSSSPGNGTRFDVYLPATDAALASSPPSNAVEVLEGGRVLLMDDDELVRETAAEVFQHLGYDVEETADGRQALDRYEDACAAGSPFDFVVLDLTVPGGMGGEETVAQLKERHPDALVVASSGYTAGGAMAEHRARGFDHALAKPYRLEDVKAVFAALEAQRAARRARSAQSPTNPPRGSRA